VKVERSRHVVLVTPPAVERVGAEVWDLLSPTSLVVVICADHEQAAQWAASAPADYRAHAVTGLARTTALLKEGRTHLLAGAPADLAALVAKSALKLDAIDTVVLAWPESFAAEVDTLLAEAPNARRVVLSWNPHVLADFLERHARRAEIVGDQPLDPDGKALGSVGTARYAIVPATRRAAAVRDALDALRATRAYVWTGGPVSPPDGADAVVCAALPSRAEMQALAGLSIGGGRPVVLALASQLAYLRSIASLTPLPLLASADRAQDRSALLRAVIAERLASGDVDAELAVLGPLFEEHDPALVAGALLALRREQGAGSGEQKEASSPVPPGGAASVKVFVSIGKKDGASAKDLVGALIKEAGLDKAQIGKIDVKETFTLVEVAPQAADQAVRRMTGVSLRGRRVTARLDRAG
jgi:hypothetical protein